jgi:DNA phosphorothioation-dependent restriction protein DptG
MINNNRRKFLKASLLSAGATVYGYGYAQGGSLNAPLKSSGMLQHTVYFWLKSGVKDKERKDFESGLKRLVDKVKALDKAEIGKPASTPSRDVVDNSFDYSLFTWFKSVADHDVYQEHEEHKRFIEKYSELWDNVRVHDSVLL